MKYIYTDTLAYRAATGTRAVRKNVSLPAWMAALAEKWGVNCSQFFKTDLYSCSMPAIHDKTGPTNPQESRV